MKYSVDGWNNFCRVFELPTEFVNDYCFGGGHATNFQMVDWFNPVQLDGQPAISKAEWVTKFGEYQVKEVDEDDLRETLIPWLLKKQYVKIGRRYLLLCNFGAAITFGLQE